MSRAVTFLVIRHGETSWNREGRIQGHRDSPLTENGLAQGRAIAARIAREPVDALHSSDLGRAMETARLIAATARLEVQVDPGLRERRFGIFEGLTWPEILRKHPDDAARQTARDPDHVIPEGESVAQFRARALGALARIAALGPDRVAVVTHGGVLDVLYREARRLPLTAPRSHSVPNAMLNRFRWEDGRWSLERWGGVEHAAEETPADDA